MSPARGGLNLTAPAPPEVTDGTLQHNNAGFTNMILGDTLAVEILADKTRLAYHVTLQMTSKAARLLLRTPLRVVVKVEA